MRHFLVVFKYCEVPINYLLSVPDNSREEDEGIEHDQDQLTRSFLCKRVLQVCASHLAVENEAQKHYKAVCRALVSEALELSNFMEKVKKHETESDCKELQELGLQDWARLWRQILKDMRDGVKLKKVDYTKTPVEYELTPYEVLMEDIRNKRFSLNKIMVDGELPPRMKKDAHDIILQFIRHRPPLKPVSNYLSYGMSQQVLDENSFFLKHAKKIVKNVNKLSQIFRLLLNSLPKLVGTPCI
mgnify:FL=1